MTGRAIHLNFAEQREAGLVIQIAEGLNLFLVARLLAAKLVAGKGQHSEGIIAEFFLQSTQPGVLIGKASAAGDVYDKTGLPRKVLKGNFFPLRIGHGELVKLSHSCSLV